MEYNFPGLSVTVEDALFQDELRMPPGDRHVVAFNLSRKPVDIHACYIAREARSHYRRFGAVSYVPAGVGLHAVGQAADAPMLMCRFEPGQRDEPFAQSGPFDLQRLEKCTDIRNRDIVRALERIAEEARNPGLGSATLIAGIAATLAVDLARLAGRADKAMLPAEHLHRLERYCAANIAGKPSLADAADLCGLSTRQLGAALKAATGLGFSQFVASLRLRQARQMLLETALPIKAIAWRCGFSHVSSFTSAFREAEGLTPHRYRMRKSH